MLETVRITPDYRNNGEFQFIRGYTGGGNPMCVHLSWEEVAVKLADQHGPGMLDDDGTDLIWMQNEDVAIPKLIEDSFQSSEL